MDQIAPTVAICKILSIVIAGNVVFYSYKPHGTCTNCCPINERDDIQFLLYTRSNPNQFYRLFLDNDFRLYNSNLQFHKPLVLFIHGFVESATAPEMSSQQLKDAFLYAGDYNVILIEWINIVSGPWYVTAVRNVPIAARYIAKFLRYLVQRGYPAEQIHLIGFSLGGQAVGYVGRELQKTGILLPRITALDPAYPLFSDNFLPPLRPEDAYFVDVIHTTAGLLGHPDPLGHADFYPNGGRAFQPGCQPKGDRLLKDVFSLLRYCSHQRSWLYFAESVRFPQAFPASRCEPSKNFPVCETLGGEVYMGGRAADSRLRGKFYLKTNDSPPYGLNTTSAMHMAGPSPPESMVTPTIMAMWEKAVQTQMPGREEVVNNANFTASTDFPKVFFEFVGLVKAAQSKSK